MSVHQNPNQIGNAGNNLHHKLQRAALVMLESNEDVLPLIAVIVSIGAQRLNRPFAMSVTLPKPIRVFVTGAGGRTGQLH